MTAQPIHTDEQPTDPQVRARLMAACDTAGVALVVSYRQHLIRGSRPSTRVACRVQR